MEVRFLLEEGSLIAYPSDTTVVPQEAMRRKKKRLNMELEKSKSASETQIRIQLNY